MLRKICFFAVLLTVLALPMNVEALAGSKWSIENSFEVAQTTLPVYKTPSLSAPAGFSLYKGMDVVPVESTIAEGHKWFKMRGTQYWVPALAPGGVANLNVMENAHSRAIEDYYGVLEQPHQFAVKLVKKEGAVGILETYEKVGDDYFLRETYEVSYRKDGPKSRYGDLKTVGGNVVRYMYRTTRSGMNGWSREHGERFGVYKLSFPMPHDGLEHLMAGRIGTHQYNKLPTINKHDNGEFYPHPGSFMGADIVLHTKDKGSRGCIMVENEEMHELFYNDLVSEENTEIIPFVIYDEDVVAPPVGQLL